jgi:hypothetical protein
MEELEDRLTLREDAAAARNALADERERAADARERIADERERNPPSGTEQLLQLTPLVDRYKPGDGLVFACSATLCGQRRVLALGGGQR